MCYWGTSDIKIKSFLGKDRLFFSIEAINRLELSDLNDFLMTKVFMFWVILNLSNKETRI